MVNTDQSLVGKWERGESEPGPSSRAKIVHALRLSPAWLWDGEGPMDLDESFSGIQAEPGPAGSTSNTVVYLSDEETRHSPEGVNWEMVVKANDEVMAYIEMGEEFSGQTSDLHEKRPRATMLVYRYLVAHGGQTPNLRDMNALMRDV